MSRLRFDHLARPALAALLVLLAACAGPYTFMRSVEPGQGLGVAEGVRLAARAMLAAGYFPTFQNEAGGQVIGERGGKDSWGTDVLVLSIDARLVAAAGGAVQLQASCSVSKNIVYTDQLDDECLKFRAAFDKLLAERAAAGRRPASSPAATPAPAPGPAPAPAPAPAPPRDKGKAISL